MIRATVFALLLGLCACGGYLPPSPTSRTVTTDDLVGTWRYQGLDSTDPATLHLRDDLTFKQTVATSGTELTQEGAWRIDGAEIVLEGVLEEFNGWKAGTAAWRIIDRDESPAGFSILGGAVDPDAWVVFSYER